MYKPSDSPSPTHIKKWAYGKNNFEVRPGWMDTISSLEHAGLLLELVHDRDCPRRSAILHCLYTLVGTIVSRHDEAEIGQLRTLLDSQTTSDLVIANWTHRSRTIMADMRKYDYNEWIAGGFAERDLPGP